MDNDLFELINEAKAGSKKALDEIIKNEQSNIYSTLYYLKKDENELSDIAQDVLIKLSKKITQLKNPKLFKTWLNQIIINSYYDYLRKNKRKITEFDNIDNDNKLKAEIPDYSTNPQEIMLNLELNNKIKTSIKMLPMRYKIPIILREIKGLSYSDISNITNTTIGTVKSRIARARNIIKKNIEKYSKL